MSLIAIIIWLTFHFFNFVYVTNCFIFLVWLICVHATLFLLWQCLVKLIYVKKQWLIAVWLIEIEIEISILFYFILFYFILFCFILFYFICILFILFYFSLLLWSQRLIRSDCTNFSPKISKGYRGLTSFNAIHLNKMQYLFFF